VGAGRIPDLIICDYRLRGEETGIAVVELLRNEFNSEVPALLVTGDTAGADRSAECGDLPLLRKPLNPARLRTLIHQSFAGEPAQGGAPAGSADFTKSPDPCGVQPAPLAAVDNPNTLKMAVTWALTVFSDRPSSLAICLLVLP